MPSPFRQSGDEVPVGRALLLLDDFRKLPGLFFPFRKFAHCENYSQWGFSDAMAYGVWYRVNDYTRGTIELTSCSDLR